jgi:hypothetical protein
MAKATTRTIRTDVADEIKVKKTKDNKLVGLGSERWLIK